MEYASFKTDLFHRARPGFNTTNLHFDRMASFMMARQQLQSSTRQKDEEDLYTIGATSPRRSSTVASSS
eukprot:2628115-Alexandrium_andersonii.AAC.1